MRASAASLRSRWRNKRLTTIGSMDQTAVSVAPQAGGIELAPQQEGAIPVIRVGVYRLVFSGEAVARRFAESAWRGAFGHALRRVACVTREKRCPDCLLYRSCGYAYVFETPPPANAAKMRRYNHVPHPFALRVEEDASHCALYLNLFGRGNTHLALIVYALAQAAAGGRGISGRQYRLQRVEQEIDPGAGEWRTIYEPDGKLQPLEARSPDIPDAPAFVRIDLRTPLRVKRNGHHVGPENFQFADLFSNLLRRISMLTSFHTDTPLETDFRELTQRAKEVHAEAALTWCDQKRYSARQEAEMQMGGVIGTLTVQGADLASFWPYLWLGQWTHAGSGATMGLGWYRLASLRERQGAA